MLRSAQYEPLIQALFRSTDYGVLMTDLEGMDIFCNPRFGALFGIDPDTVVHLPQEEVRRFALARIKDPERFNALMDRVYADPWLEFEDEIELTLPGERVLRRHTAPVLNNEGHVQGRVWTFFDITETRRLQREVSTYARQLETRLEQQALALKAAQDELLEAAQMEAVGTLAMGIAHDLRNILTTLRLEIAAQETPYPAFASQQFDRLYTLTHSLLALTEEIPLIAGPVAVDEILDFVFSLLKGQADIDNARLRKRVARNVPPVLGNARRLEQLFVNLLRNALNAIAPTGGTVLVTVRCDAAQVRVDIQDDGPGIAPENISRLFEPFFTTRANHTGLGLFSARRIVESHQGSIGIKSRNGQGTRVSVWLPMADLPPASLPKRATGKERYERQTASRG